MMPGIGRTRGTPNMPDTTIIATDQSLNELLRTEADFPGYALFHPKIYLGTLHALACAMIGSSNLTNSGLSTNVEQNLFVTGQRHSEPFRSIETQIAAFVQQAYLFRDCWI